MSHQIQESLKRKQEIIKELEHFRHTFSLQKPFVKTIEKDTPFIPDTNTPRVTETLLKENDALKAENVLLLQKVSRMQETESELAVTRKELEVSKSLSLSHSFKINELNNVIQSLQENIQNLQKEKLILQSQIESRPLISKSEKRWDSNEKQAMMHQQQTLILEVEKLKTEQSKYQDLIKNIEAAVSMGKICIVSNRGLVVTTMIDLAMELSNEKKAK